MTKLKPNQFKISGATVTERPILFSTDMVKVNMEGRKTQTRRNVNPQPDKGFNPGTYGGIPCIGNFSLLHSCKSAEESALILKKFKYSPYGNQGDLLWVRETWRKVNQIIATPAPSNSLDHPINQSHIDYKSNWSDGITSHPKNEGIWKPSIHMPKSASRLWLMVEDISVERVQGISEEDAKAEGVRYIESDNLFQRGYFNYGSKDIDEPNLTSAKPSFESLWISINCEESWESNPWVWVIQYRVLSKTGKPDKDTIHRNYFEVTGKEAINDT